MVDDLPWRQIVGQQAPRAAAADPIGHGVDQLPSGIPGGTAPGLSSENIDASRAHSASDRSVSLGFS